MNKKLLTTAIVSMMVLSTGAAMAAPVEIDGSASYRYRHDTNEIQNVSTGKTNNIFRFTLNAKTAIDSNLSAYARFASESLSNASNPGSDMVGYSGRKNLGSIDQFGLTYTNKDFTAKMGKQAAFIGGTGLLYDSTGYLSKYNSLTGINITAKTGVTSIDVMTGKENNKDTEDNKVHSIRASFSPVKDLTLGATFARYDAAKDTNFYAVDAAYTQGKVTYSAEYAKSNADKDNKAYDIGVSYAFDDKNSVSFTNFNVNDNGSINWMTSYDVGKGNYYSYSHKFNKETSASLFYRDYNDNAPVKTHNTSFRATVNYSF